MFALCACSFSILFQNRDVQLGALLAQEGLLSAPVTLAFDKLSVTIAGNEVLRNVSGVIAPGACVFKLLDSFFDSRITFLVYQCVLFL